jgi:hypothetical protein
MLIDLVVSSWLVDEHDSVPGSLNVFMVILIMTRVA